METAFHAGARQRWPSAGARRGFATPGRHGAKCSILTSSTARALSTGRVRRPQRPAQGASRGPGPALPQHESPPRTPHHDPPSHARWQDSHSQDQSHSWQHQSRASQPDRTRQAKIDSTGPIHSPARTSTGARPWQGGAGGATSYRAPRDAPAHTSTSRARRFPGAPSPPVWDAYANGQRNARRTNPAELQYVRQGTGAAPGKLAAGASAALPATDGGEEAVIAYLMDVLEMTRKQACQAVERASGEYEKEFPGKWGWSVDEVVRPTVEVLLGTGLTVDDARKAIRVCPDLLRRRSDTIRAKLDCLASVGAPDVVIRRAITNFPGLLRLSAADKILPTLEWLRRDVGLSDRQLHAVLRHFPQVFGYSRESRLSGKLATIVRLGLSPQELRDVLGRFPAVMGLSEQRITATWGHMRAYGLSEDEVRALVRGFPSLLGYKASTLDLKIIALICLLQMPLEAAVAFPTYFGYSLEQRVGPRAAFMRSVLGDANGVLPLRELVGHHLGTEPTPGAVAALLKRACSERRALPAAAATTAEVATEGGAAGTPITSTTSTLLKKYSSGKLGGDPGWRRRKRGLLGSQDDAGSGSEGPVGRRGARGLTGSVDGDASQQGPRSVDELRGSVVPEEVPQTVSLLGPVEDGDASPADLEDWEGGDPVLRQAFKDARAARSASASRPAGPVTGSGAPRRPPRSVPRPFRHWKWLVLTDAAFVEWLSGEAGRHATDESDLLQQSITQQQYKLFAEEWRQANSQWLKELAQELAAQSKV
ncbi:unnamed protein product [Pedinophyceae sp. YPF-701]|nr:unnamed protein product [Pedinophyceae sp. YPF-701]